MSIVLFYRKIETIPIQRRSGKKYMIVSSDVFFYNNLIYDFLRRLLLSRRNISIKDRVVFQEKSIAVPGNIYCLVTK